MAKKLKKQELYYVKDTLNRVLVDNKFVYEIMIFVQSFRTYYLFDTITVSSKEYKPVGRYQTKKNGNNIFQEYLLIAAPESWLIDNKYQIDERK